MEQMVFICTLCNPFPSSHDMYIHTVKGNDPYDTSIPCSVNGAKAYVEAVRAAYPDASPIFSVDNEPTLWSGTHRDVHPGMF